MTQISDQAGAAITNMEPGKRGTRAYFDVDDINAGASAREGAWRRGKRAESRAEHGLVLHLQGPARERVRPLAERSIRTHPARSRSRRPYAGVGADPCVGVVRQASCGDTAPVAVFPATTQTAAPAPAPTSTAPQIPVVREDPGVAIAFAVGWQMAALYRDADRRQPDSHPIPSELPGLGSFTDSQRTEFGLRQIQSGLHRLSDRISAAGLTLPQTGPFRDAFEGRPDPATGRLTELRGRLLELHVEILETFTAVDFRLGKAYGLGRGLADTAEVADRRERAVRSRARLPGSMSGSPTSTQRSRPTPVARCECR